jgi:hypothetical protein
MLFVVCHASASSGDGSVQSGETLKVKAKKRHSLPDGTRTYSDWVEYETRTIDQLPGFAGTPEPESSIYGGRKDKRVAATGFFHAANVDGRWWLADPDGYLFIHKAIASIKPGTSTRQIKALEKKFGTQQAWMKQSVHLLAADGFNGAGNWSEADMLKTSETPVAYTRGFFFMANYGISRGGTFQQPGHIGYPKDLIFVFDPGFEQFCDREAREAAQFKDERSLVGYFSDNEMPFPDDALDRYLSLPSADPGHQAAERWLLERKGTIDHAVPITKDDQEAFLTVVAEKYFSLVSAALKKYDPNHMYLGCRFHGSILKKKPVFQAAGKYLDVVSVNYYDVWTPSSAMLANWAAWSGKPILITEWYTKGEDSGLGNTTGAGWIVPTQRDRGLFYQNFVLALLESKVCVGWHWFKYQDNDPTDKNADPSNFDANKGVVNTDFEPYSPLLEEMRKVNVHVYGLTDYFARTRP